MKTKGCLKTVLQCIENSNHLLYEKQNSLIFSQRKLLKPVFHSSLLWEFMRNTWIRSETAALVSARHCQLMKDLMNHSHLQHKRLCFILFWNIHCCSVWPSVLCFNTVWCDSLLFWNCQRWVKTTCLWECAQMMFKKI